MSDEAERRNYVVTDMAGRRVAGRVVKVGDVLSLTELEAEHELREGTLEPKGLDPKPAEPAPGVVKRVKDALTGGSGDAGGDGSKAV